MSERSRVEKIVQLEVNSLGEQIGFGNEEIYYAALNNVLAAFRQGEEEIERFNEEVGS